MTALVVRLMDGFLRLLARTWRLELVRGEELFEEFLESGEPMIVCLWHDRIIPGAGLYLRRMVPAGLDLTLLTSASRDGELADRFFRLHGSRVVRGSSSRRGARALRRVVRAVRRHRSSPVVVPDGPKGPPYGFKDGVVGIARLTGIAVLGLGLAADRFRTLGTWDRMIVPAPFSRVAVAADRLEGVPPELSREEMEQHRERYERELMELTRAAESAIGRGDPLPSNGELAKRRTGDGKDRVVEPRAPSAEE